MVDLAVAGADRVLAVDVDPHDPVDRHLLAGGAVDAVCDVADGRDVPVLLFESGDGEVADRISGRAVVHPLLTDQYFGAALVHGSRSGRGGRSAMGLHLVLLVWVWCRRPYEPASPRMLRKDATGVAATTWPLSIAELVGAQWDTASIPRGGDANELQQHRID
ncbi:hypothetical protein [Prescottella equi]